jgi:hypothetical protein
MVESPGPAPRRQSRTWMKWTAIGCGGVLLLVAVAALALRHWWSQNEEAMRAEARVAADSGAAYAAAADQAGCVAEGMRRAEGGGGLRRSVANTLWVRGCLENAAPTAGLCAEVPPRRRVMETARWQREECGDNQPCIAVLQAVQEFCYPDGRGEEPTDAEVVAPPPA